MDKENDIIIRVVGREEMKSVLTKLAENNLLKRTKKEIDEFLNIFKSAYSKIKGIRLANLDTHLNYCSLRWYKQQGFKNFISFEEFMDLDLEKLSLLWELKSVSTKE